MAKNSIPEYDSTESNNTDLGGTSTLGTQTGSKIDDLFRRLMSHLKNFQMSAVFGGQLTAPLSASVPAYSITGDTDTGIGSQSANTLSVFAGNATTPRMTVGAAGIDLLQPLSVSNTAGGSIFLTDSDAATSEKNIRIINSDGDFFIQSMDDSKTSASTLMKGVRSTGNAFTEIQWYTQGVVGLKLDSARRLLIGDASYTGTDINDPGCSIQGAGATAPGAISSTVSSSAALFINRHDTPGNVVEFYGAASFSGSISQTGGVVSYNTFCGAHWSQLIDQSRPEFLRGTIVETIDEMSFWLGDTQPNEHLPCFKVSDTAGSTFVYGVFMGWSRDTARHPKTGEIIGEIDTSDATIASLGAYMVRIASGETVQRGDLIESAGNGCGRVQGDGVMRSSTVAKVTSPYVIETYSDGSYLVPATLHCG